jgi:hypothetical protein
MDELKAIREYAEDVPKIRVQVRQVNATVNEANDRPGVIEAPSRNHEGEIRRL